MKKKENRARIYGKMMLLEGGMLLVPILCLLFYPKESKYFPFFVLPGFGSILLGSMVLKRKSGAERVKKEKGFDRKAGSSIVLFAWVYGFLIAAVPFAALKGYTPTQIIFETVSGFTTTGLSTLDVTSMPHIFLFYRSFLQFMGGLGFVLMMLVFIQGKDSMELYWAEGHTDKLMPSIGRTAQVIFGIYSIFFVLGVGMYLLCKMPLFDSILNTMCALSTGGFSNKLNSIAEYHSMPIESVTVFLMLIGTTNFSVLLLLLKGKWRKLLKVSEIRFLAVVVALSVPLMAFLLVTQNQYEVKEAVRLSFFNIFSAASTTGFATSSYQNWAPGAVGIMIVLMLIGGGAGSTAGGMKLSRVYVVLRCLWVNVEKKFSPERQIKNSYYVKASEEKSIISTEVAGEAFTYIGTYLLLYLIGTLALTTTADCSLSEAMFEFASSLGTVGLSIGITSAEANGGTLWILIGGMVLGRLEIFTVFLGLAQWFGRNTIQEKRCYWRKEEKKKKIQGI